jgi:Ribbon-helix-helix protein, copG family
MRTTLTVDEDLARQLKEIARRSDQSFKVVVNETIRRGLQQGDKPHRGLAKFVVRPKACGFRAGVDPAKLNQLIDELDAEDFQRELHVLERR